MITRLRTSFSFFFFSSRRRHTRFKCDWSSDVCSSDLRPGRAYNLLAPGDFSAGATGQISTGIDVHHKGTESNSMNAELNRIADLIPDVLRSWNIAPDDIVPISARGNSHWRVRCRGDDFVLRMYRRGQSEPSIRYELDILKRLRSLGWPVAAAADETVFHSAFVCVLFP